MFDGIVNGAAPIFSYTTLTVYIANSIAFNPPKNPFYDLRNGYNSNTIPNLKIYILECFMEEVYVPTYVYLIFIISKIKLL